MIIKIGDKLIRNNVPLHRSFDTDPHRIKIVGFAIMDEGDSVNGYIMQDLHTKKKEDCTYDYLREYYILDQRKEKLLKLKDYTSQNQQDMNIHL